MKSKEDMEIEFRNLEKEVRALRTKRDGLKSDIKDLCGTKTEVSKEVELLNENRTKLQEERKEIESLKSVEINKAKVEVGILSDTQKVTEDKTEVLIAKENELKYKEEQFNAKLASYEKNVIKLKEHQSEFEEKCASQGKVKSDYEALITEAGLKEKKAAKLLLNLEERQLSLRSREDKVAEQVDKINKIKDQHVQRLKEVRDAWQKGQLKENELEKAKTDLNSTQLALEKKIESLEISKNLYVEKRNGLDRIKKELDLKEKEIETKRLRIEKIVRDRKIENDLKALQDELGVTA